MTRRLAIFLVGGIGRGIASQGVPSIAVLTVALARNFQVSVYSLLRPHPGFRPDGYTIHSPPFWLSGSTKKLRWAWLAANFAHEHRKAPFGVLLSFWGYPMGAFVVALAKLVGRPSVITILGAEAASVPSIQYGFLRQPATRRLVLEACERASAVVVLSSDQRETLRRHGLRREVEVIPFGADREMFAPAQKARRPPLKILHVANLTPVKDQATLLRGFAYLRREMDARLRIVGPDLMKGTLQRLTGELGVENDVEFAGPVAHAEIPAHHAWADMFVMTSLSEGQNVAVAEAAMSGVLVVGTPVGCIKDLGEDAAVVVRIGDPEDLSAKIQAIVSDLKQWDRKVGAARAWAETHDFHWTVERMCSVLDETGTWK